MFKTYLGVCHTLASLPGAATPGKAATHLWRRARSYEVQRSIEVMFWSYFEDSRKGLKSVCICLYVYICVFMPELASLPVRGIRPRRVAPPPSIPPDYYHEDYYHHEEDNVYDNGDDGRRE